uniref:Uncharacterized protein n=1 Tax=Monopterus albus TaxID=43700 RepID=A0A3Q3KF96_MONAL
FSFPPASSEEIHLRHVEKDVLIPKLMREKARVRCAEKVEGVYFYFCHILLKLGLVLITKCNQATLFLSSTSYKDPTFFEECKQEYIKEKLEFERTGIPAKNRKQKLPNSM